MKKLVISLVAVLVVASSAFAVKQYVDNVGNVDKAKPMKYVITAVNGSFRCDVYWNLLDSNKVVLAENRKTSFSVVSANGKCTFAQAQAIWTNQMPAHIAAQKTAFANDSGD